MGIIFARWWTAPLDIEDDMTERKAPKVSVWMPAYFAEAYIAEAIESILMQKTDYPFEIVINDDCSGDGTWNVISRYAEEYPDIISAKRNEKNLGLCANVLDTKRRCRGEYIINCSADDYWIDENKIQKQADFLESHPDYIGVGTKVEMRYGRSKTAHASYPVKSCLGKDFTIEAYNRNINLPSHGFMVRNFFGDPEKKELIDRVYSLADSIDDVFDPVLFLQFGRIFIMEEATCVYRVEPEKKAKHNFNSTNSPLKKASIIVDAYNKMEALGFPGLDLRTRYVVSMNIAILSGLTSFKMKKVRELYRSIPEKYRKPFRDSVAYHCAFFGVWETGTRQWKRRKKRNQAKKEQSEQ